MSLNAKRTRRPEQALDTLWYVLSAPQVTAALFVLLAVTFGLAAVFPQLPSGIEVDEFDRWLTTAAGQFPGAGTFLRAIGAFELLRGAWIRALMVVLGLNLLLRVAAQARFLHNLQRPSTIPLPPQRVISRRATLPGPLEQTVARLRKALEPQYFVTIEQDAAHAQIFAQRRPTGAFGPLTTYVGLVFLLAGLVVDDAIGWRAADIALAPGNTRTLNRPGALQIVLGEVDGESATARADLTLTHAGRSQTVHSSLTHPARWGNLWLSQQATGPALAVSATDSGSRALVLQSLGQDGEVGPDLRILFQQTQNEQGFAIPTRDLTFRVVSYAALPEQGIAEPVFLVEAYRGEETAPIATEFVEDEGSLTLNSVDNVTLTLQRDRYVVLEVAYLPGLPLMLLGGLLTLAGIALSAYGSIARVWVHLAADGEQLLAIIAAAGPAVPQREIGRLLQTACEPITLPEPSDAA